MAEKDPQSTGRDPGVCIPWQEKMKDLPEIKGDPEIVKRVWEDVDSLAYIYIWHCLESF
jgi:hypothetical protein